MQISIHSCPDCKTAFHISPLFANNEVILKYVDFTKAVTGRFHMPLNTLFIDSIRFIVMWPHCFPMVAKPDYWPTYKGEIIWHNDQMQRINNVVPKASVSQLK